MRSLLLAGFSLIVLNASAQKLYFKAGLGAAFAQGGALQNTSGLPIDGSYSGTFLPTNSSESFEMKKASYTSGLQAILGFGLMLKKNVGVEIAANIGAQTKLHQSEFYNESSGRREHGTITTQSDKPLILTPSIVVQTGGKINIYSRGGLAIPVISRVNDGLDYTQEIYNQATNSFVVSNINLTEEYRMHLSPGFAGAVGVKYKAAKKLMVWAEAGLMYLNLYHKQSTLTSYSEDGISYLSQIPSSERVTQYDFKGTSNGTSNISPTSQVQFSNFNISLGVEFDLK